MTDRQPTVGDVYLFTTCVIELFEPQAGLDAVRVLERAGLRVHVPEAQSCCGQPAYTSGHPEQARQVAAAQLDAFAEPYPVIVPSGSCAGMIIHHWKRLFADDPLRLAKAEAIASRCREFTEFVGSELAHILPPAASPTAPPVRVALHTSCSARREMGSLQHGRQLLEQLPGVELCVQHHESECCGFGGTFSIRHPQISAAMASDKLDAIASTGCGTLLSADCGCLLNLRLSAGKQGLALPCQHIASFLQQRLEQSA